MTEKEYSFNRDNILIDFGDSDIGSGTVEPDQLEVIPEPRTEYKPNVPRVETIQIPKDMIGPIIGPGGKNIQQMHLSDLPDFRFYLRHDLFSADVSNHSRLTAIRQDRFLD